MGHQGLLKTFLILAAALCFCREARADLYFEQDVHSAQKGAVSENGVSEFKRKIFITDGLFSIQIAENGALQKEYGFDFKKNLYYEADPAAGFYKWFALDVLETAFEKTVFAGTPSGRASRRNIADELARAMLQGKKDYPLEVRRTWTGRRKIGGRQTRLYKLRAGPGSFFFNPFGWVRSADIWATTDVPNFSEYTLLRTHLQTKARFYKMKDNRVSDVITMLGTLEAFPLRVDSVTKRKSGRLNARKTGYEITSFISSSGIDTGRLLYVKDAKKFSWNVLFSKGTDFGPETSAPMQESPGLLGSLLGSVLPASFLVLSFLWFFGGYQEKDGYSLGRLVVLRAYTLVGALLVLEIGHYIADIPFLVSPVIEFASLAGGGVLWIIYEARLKIRNLETRMREAHLKHCPHCRARIEEFYVVCPKCNR